MALTSLRSVSIAVVKFRKLVRTSSMKEVRSGMDITSGVRAVAAAGSVLEELEAAGAEATSGESLGSSGRLWDRDRELRGRLLMVRIDRNGLFKEKFFDFCYQM